MNVTSQIALMSIAHTSTIREVMRVIDRAGLGCALLVVPETRRFAGLVTDGDIRRALLSGQGLDSLVSGVPRPEPKTGRAGMAIDQVKELFGEEVRVAPLLDDAEQVVDLAVFDRRMRLPVAEPWLGEKEVMYVTECVLTGWVSSAGKFVTEFETSFAEFCGSRHAIAVSNGTSALHLALLALGVGEGDEVIVPALTFIATANAVAYTGATPVVVDSEPGTWNIDSVRVEEAITPRTKGIIAVHLYGHPADMDALADVADRHHLFIVEDAAEAHGARYKGRRVGSIGAIGAFSFYGNKIITTGEGGMITTDRSDLVDRIRMLRDHGMASDKRYWHPVVGYNYRLTNLQAALGVAQMEKVEAILSSKKRLALAYDEGLRDVPGLTLPPKAAWGDPVYWLYSVLIDPERFGQTRDDVMGQLAEKGIETRPVFVPLHQQPIYRDLNSRPVAERLADRGLSLPSAVGLKPTEISRVVAAIVELQARTAG